MSLGAAFAGFAQGAAQGYGIRRQMDRDAEDKKDREEARKDREAERQYLAAERERVRQEQEREQALLRGLSEVKRTDDSWGTDYQWARDNNAPMRDDEGNVMPGVRSMPRSRADILRDQASVAASIPSLRAVWLAQQFDAAAVAEADRVRGIGRQNRLDTEAAEDRKRTNELRDIQFRQAQAGEALQQARMLFADGNLQGALAALGKTYSFYPDGKELVMGPNGAFGLATVGKDGKPVAASAMMPATRESVGKAIELAMQIYNPDVWLKLQGNARSNSDSDAKNEYYRANADYLRGDKGKVDRVIGRAGDDGTQIVTDRSGNPVHVLLPGGLKAPLGWTADRLRMEEDKAKKLGVRVAIGEVNGAPIAAYIGRDGKAYSSMEEASKAKPVR